MKGWRKCKMCSVEFEKKQPLQFVCSINCSIKYTARNTAEANHRANVKNKSELRERLKTWSDYYQETLVIFNSFIRHRDAEKECISCKAPAGKYKITSGHFHPQGTYRSVAFNEDNAHGQCWFNCNKNKHGNLSEYRPNLIERIGQERVDEIDRLRNTELKLSIPDLVAIKVKYKKKIKQLTNDATN